MIARGRSRLRALLTAASIAALAPTGAAAQEVTTAYRGLFNAAPDASRTRSSWLTWSLEGASDRNEISSDANAAASGAVRDYSDAVAQFGYADRGRVLAYTLTADAALRYDAAGGQTTLLKNLLTASMATAPQRRTDVRVSASYLRAPYTLLTLDGPTAIDSSELLGADRFVSQAQTTIDSVSAAVGRRLFGRTRLEAELGVRETTLTEGAPDLFSQRATLRLERPLGRSLLLAGGYTYEHGTYGRANLAPLTSREGDLDLQYRPRRGRLRVAFGAGTAMVDEGGLARRRATGYARVERGIGRAWSAVGEYRRGVDVQAGFFRPLVVDAYTATAGGYIGRRLDVVAFGGWWVSNTTSAEQPTYRSDREGARVRFAVARAYAVYVEYLRYQYRFGSPADVPLSLADEFLRRGLRVGVMSRLPLFR